MPILPNFLATHQWPRELERRGQGTIVAIDFRLPREQVVWVGHCGRLHAEISLGQSIGILMENPDPMGWEVIVPRSIPPGQVIRVRRPSQIFGWRYHPGSHEKRPTCACRTCLPEGMIRPRRLSHRLDPTGESRRRVVERRLRRLPQPDPRG